MDELDLSSFLLSVTWRSVGLSRVLAVDGATRTAWLVALSSPSGQAPAS